MKVTIDGHHMASCPLLIMAAPDAETDQPQDKDTDDE